MISVNIHCGDHFRQSNVYNVQVSLYFVCRVAPFQFFICVSFVLFCLLAVPDTLYHNQSWLWVKLVAV